MDLENLSIKIKSGLEEIGKPFSDFHEKSKMACPPTCGKCCYNPEIACHPYELLPLALDLLERNLAEEYLAKAKNSKDGICVLLDKVHPESGLGRCTDYQNRPSICRAFAVSGRLNKKNEIELSVCKKLKEIYSIEDFHFANDEVPYISLVKRKLEAIDPAMIGPQININEALIIILEKVLLRQSFLKTNQ